MSSWISFDDGKTIGTKGSENGLIISDEEHLNGARITLEEKAFDAPYAITFGIYGVLFHTNFLDNLEKSKAKYNLLKKKIESIIEHLSIEEKERKDNWEILFNDMTDHLIVKK
ncbi:hypothetical protein [Winogradskyella sp.]|uniref:hypothetical protein n=1 Tax=Winogradskyella sp. TaxID=1883156 RepID=UPI003F6C739E